MNTTAISSAQSKALRWNAKADSSTQILMWLVAAAAAIICMLWLGKSISPAHLVMDKVQADLDNLQMRFSDACNSEHYLSRYNALTEEGNLSISNTEICIRSKTVGLCAYLACATSLKQTILLDDITNLVIRKDNAAFTISTE